MRTQKYALVHTPINYGATTTITKNNRRTTFQFVNFTARLLDEKLKQHKLTKKK